MTFRFLEESWLYLILLLPVMYLFESWFNKRRKKKLEASFGNHTLPFLAQSFSPERFKWTRRLFYFGLLFLFVALARPQGGSQSTNVKNEGIEIIFAIDVSNSMLAEDIKPSRLDLAKKTVERIMGKFIGHKVGLIAFAGSAAVQAPMTNDYSAVKMYLESLGPDSVGRQGTQFKLAIDSARELLNRGGLGQEEGVNATQALVILSDGEDNEEGAIESAKEMSKEGRLIFTIAVGTLKGAPIPIRDEFGVLKGHKQDGSGQTVLTTLKEALLEQIAKEGGGESFVATVGGDEVDRFVKSIDRLGRAVFEKKQASDYAEYYQFPLLISLFCFFLFVFVSRRRKAPRVWKGRFELASVVLVFGFCLSSYAQSEPDGKEKPNPYREKCLIDPKLSVGEDVQGLGVSAVFKTKDAIASFSDKKFSESLMKFTELSVENPDIPLLTFNLASGFVGAEQVDQAVKEYERLFTTAQTQDLKYLAAFNLGVLEAARMSPERPSAETSLKWYQKALEFRPDSIETKNNIELLIQQQQQQQQQGGGGGEGDKNDSDENDGDKDKQDQQNQPRQMVNRREVKDKFQSKELTKQDVRDIFEELERQDKGVRTKLNEKESKGTEDLGKDW